MLPDLFVIRVVLRMLIMLLKSIAPASIVFTLLSLGTSPASPFVLFLDVSALEAHESLLSTIQVVAFVETVWWFVHSVARRLIAAGWWDLGPVDDDAAERIGTEERWRLWKAMLESDRDPSKWLLAMFMKPKYRRAKEGMRDAAVCGFSLRDVGRPNVEEYVAHYLFRRSLRDVKRDSLDKAELHAMVSLLELVLSEAPANAEERKPFRFAFKRSKHQPFLLYSSPIVTDHHPLFFYLLVFLFSGMGNTALWLAGFRYYGSVRTWPFPLFFMRGSKKALDQLSPLAPQLSGDARLADKVGYWYHPGSEQAQRDARTPVVFFHGISGTYGPAAFIIMLQRCTGRPFFIPEFPYVTMRLNPPSTIFTRREMVAAVRRMLYRHGFGLTSHDEPGDYDEGDDWRTAKAVLLAHSLGAGPVAWLLRDAPDIVAGTVLVDPMSVLLFAADAPRNFFRSRAKTAGEMFFKYFTRERGITHFLARHLKWTDSVIFAGPTGPVPLPAGAIDLIPKIAREPLHPPKDIPNYAPFISPSPSGPFPSILFFSENDCILPVPKILCYMRGVGFGESSLRVLPGLDHAAILIRPDWTRKVGKAIDDVAVAAEEVVNARLLEASL